MNKIKLFISITIVFAFFHLLTTQVFAADLEVTFESDPLFPSAIIWCPGLSETRSIKVKNNSGETEKIAIEAINESETGNLASVLEFKVLEEGIERYNSSKTLKDFWDGGIIQLSDLEGGKDTTYELTITFKSTAGNEYQDKEAKFDLKIGFYSEAAEGFKEAVTVAGIATPWVCTATAPTSAPVLSAYASSSNTVVLTWTPVSPVTHYTIRYGLSSGSYIYGAPDVGNVTSYVVGALSAGTTYYFQVAGVNDCMPGPWSNEASATPTGLVLGLGPAPEFEEILGVEEEEMEEKILGEIACEDEYYPWWLSLVGQAVLGAFVLWLIRKRKEETERWWLIPLALALVSQIIHEILGCNCATGDWCPRYWLLNLGILALSLLAYKVVAVLPKKE